MPATPSSAPHPLGEDVLRAIAERGVVRSYPKNTILIHEGDRSDTLYILLSGKVKVYASSEQGKEVVLNIHGPGEYVGEMALDQSPRTASVVTLEPTACAQVSGQQLREFIVQNPEFALHLIRKLIERARIATEGVKQLALLDVYGRVSRLLNTLAVEQDGVRTIPERLTQQDIAERVGSSRDMITRIFRELTAGGYIEISDHHIRLTKPLPHGW